MMNTDVVVIGGGAAGLAAALEAAETTDVMILERNMEVGGVLPQCIHDGFGSFIFNEMMTGPEYAQVFIDQVLKHPRIDVKTGTTVLGIQENKKVIAVNTVEGVLEIQAKAIVLAMGCREKTRSQILLPGTRPAGVYTAGTAQRLMNIDGVMPGRKIVILGSGDVGLIMARRFTLEGATVEGVYEILSNPTGLTRNIVQCLNDFDIHLHLSHTVVEIHGNKRVEGVTVAEVDENLQPLRGTERFIPCDCLILAVGLIPENELSKQIGIPLDKATGGPIVDDCMETMRAGFFACGNVVQVHDLVDHVTLTGRIAGKHAAKYAQGITSSTGKIKITKGRNIASVVPQFLNRNAVNTTFYLRVKHLLRDVYIVFREDETVLHMEKKKVVRPAEMERITFSDEVSLEDVSGEIIVEVTGNL